MTKFRTNRKTKKAYPIIPERIGLSDFIPVHMNVSKKEFQYRINHGAQLWENLRGIGAFCDHFKLDKKDRRVCQKAGAKCPECHHTKNCESRCSHRFHGKPRWNW